MISCFFTHVWNQGSPEDISAGCGVPACYLWLKVKTCPLFDLQFRLKRIFSERLPKRIANLLKYDIDLGGYHENYKEIRWIRVSYSHG